MTGTVEREWEFARLESEGPRADVVIARQEKRNAMHEGVLRDLTADGDTPWRRAVTRPFRSFTPFKRPESTE